MKIVLTLANALCLIQGAVTLALLPYIRQLIKTISFIKCILQAQTSTE